MATTPWVISNHGLRRSGGIEQYLCTLVRGLHDRGMRPVVVAKSFDGAQEEVGWVDPVKIGVGALPGKLRDLWFDWRLQRLKAKRGWFPLIALNQTAAADIAICGSNHPAHLVAMAQPSRFWDRRKIALERSHLENSKVVIAHSQLLASQVVEHYDIRRSKIRVVYPPVDERRFRPIEEAQRLQLRAQFGFPADRPVFLLASTGHARKGLDIAVAALAGSGAILALAGRPPAISAPHLRYLGYRTDMEAVYQAADCTLIASRYEPFGLVGIESVLCGTPVIAARAVGCAEVLSPRAAWRFDVDEPFSLSAAVGEAMARWQDGTLHLASPQSEIAYDPSIESHLDILLEWVTRLTSVRVHEHRAT